MNNGFTLPNAPGVGSIFACAAFHLLTTIDQQNAPNQGDLHAAALIAMADSTCGYEAVTIYPPGRAISPRSS